LAARLGARNPPRGSQAIAGASARLAAVHGANARRGLGPFPAPAVVGPIRRMPARPPSSRAARAAPDAPDL